MNEKQISLRLPEDLLARIEKLVPKLAKDPDYSLWRVSRGATMRLALQTGVEELEAKYSGKKTRRKPNT
jgi:hypothetical protein